MTKYIRAFFAIARGLQFCLTVPAVRRLAIVPWAVGTLCYVASVYGAYRLHPVLLDWAVGDLDGIWQYFLYGLGYLFFAMILLVSTLLITVTIVIVFTGVFQTGIVLQVLRLLEQPIPEELNGVRGLVKETSRTVVVETTKLFWLLPLMLIVLVVGLIPLFTPFALVLGAWLLAYQFVDIVLDTYRLSSRERFRFGRENALLLVAFGFSLSLVWAIPLLGILLPPAAVAAATWLLAESELLDTLGENQAKNLPGEPVN
jgi:CysZ protein